MKSSTLHLHTRYQVGPVDRRIFGGFLEHMGRAVYGGVYDPESPRADSHGWRTDVLESLRGLDMTVMRYPGGNFVSGSRLHFDAGGLPYNTHGGLLSHAYVLGIAHVVEVVRQLRGEAANPVPGAEVGVYGGYTGATASTLVMRRGA